MPKIRIGDVLPDHYLDDTLFQHSQLLGGCMRNVNDPVAHIGSPVSYLYDDSLVVFGIGHLQQGAERIGAVCTGEAVSVVGGSV